MIGFIQGEIAGEKLVAGDVFPKTLMPAAASGGDLAKLVLEEREHLFADLRRHRALLFRGFDVSDSGDFHRAVEAFRWEAIEMKSSASTRTKITSRVYSANEAPPEQLINFHHEMPLMTEMPRMLFFCCGESSPQGGETAIVASDVVVQRMEERMPEVMAKVAEVGLVFSIKTASDAEAADPETVVNRTWKSLLGTDDETEAEKRLLEMHESCSSVKFLSNGSAELVFGPTNPVREFSGRRAWIYPILGFAGDRRSVKNEFGDGSDFPAEALEVYRRILEENCVDINWRKGDVLLLDNLAVQHARRPGKPPRRILASLFHRLFHILGRCPQQKLKEHISGFVWLETCNIFLIRLGQSGRIRPPTSCSDDGVRDYPQGGRTTKPIRLKRRCGAGAELLVGEAGEGRGEGGRGLAPARPARRTLGEQPRDDYG